MPKQVIVWLEQQKRRCPILDAPLPWYYSPAQPESGFNAPTDQFHQMAGTVMKEGVP